ncbi:RHS repeat domain-containing protein [Cyclobacterium plantarum]|uniref:RHS repeat domain-containing protein n=1 Tax=Cyclobacterium plantarum TaxID=2716263 RepID=UPI003F6EC705
MTYSYYEESNKLKNVDLTETENYTYDQIGNLIRDNAEGIDSIAWTPYGKVRAVFKDDNSEVRFRYDAAGNRIAKITDSDTTIYVRDASGNVMGVYNNKTLKEQAIYGSSRLGLINYASQTAYRTLGGKKYELSNHLGNVLAVVSDNIHLDQDSTWTTAINTTDYYPFGLAMDGRTVQDSTYRYGFNGKEEDSSGEWGGQSHYDYGFRIYNPSIGKFLSVDPLTSEFPWNSPYAFAENDVIRSIDLEGLEKAIITEYNIAGDGSTKLRLTHTYDNLGGGQWEGTKYLEQYNKVDNEGKVTNIYTDYNDRDGTWQSGVASLKMKEDGVQRMASKADLNYGNLLSNFNQSYRGQKFNSTVSNYITSVSLPISGIGILKAPTMLQKAFAGMSFLNGIDDLTGNFSNDGNTVIQNQFGGTLGNVTKSAFSLAGILGGGSGLMSKPYTGTAPIDNIIGIGSDTKSFYDGVKNTKDSISNDE